MKDNKRTQKLDRLRTEILALRLTKQEKIKLSYEANKVGMTMSEVIRQFLPI